MTLTNELRWNTVISDKSPNPTYLEQKWVDPDGKANWIAIPMVDTKRLEDAPGPE